MNILLLNALNAFVPEVPRAARSEGLQAPTFPKVYFREAGFSMTKYNAGVFAIKFKCGY